MTHSDTIPSATTAKTRFVEAIGRRIAYRSVGKGAPIILCNRYKGILDTWDPAFIDNLAQHFTVITFDYSGLALSTGTPPSDILSMANDARDIAEALKLEKIIIGGWSLGGMAAQTVTTHYPELVSHAILIGTAPPGKNDHAPERLFFETAAKPVKDLADEIIIFFEPKSEASRNAAKLTHDRIAKRTSDLDAPISAPVWDSLYKAGADFYADRHNSREKLKTTTIPILVISGDHDIVCPVENWFALTRELPTMQLIVFPQAGHGPQHQYPGIAAEYITTFIRNTK
jgi:pimeloyl-ACP methyl ester carboxylesterase